MSFDIPSFLADLDEIRSLWLTTSLGGEAPPRRTATICRSAVSSPKAVNIQTPSDPLHPSNHQVLVFGERDLTFKAFYNRMDTNLRRIKAFDFPRLLWKLELFEVRPSRANPNRLPAFNISILNAPLWDDSHPIRKHTLAADRLELLAADLACVSKPLSGRRFTIGRYAIDADSPLDAARLYTALTHPGFLRDHTKGHLTLPSITEILDPIALSRQLRPSSLDV